MAQYDFTYTVGFLADTKAMTSSIKAFSGTLGAGIPFSLKPTVPKGTDLGSSQKLLDTLRKTAVEINNVTLKTQTMTTASGKSYTAVTGMVVKYINSAGIAETKTIAVGNSIKKLETAIPLFKKMAEGATEAGTRAENMGSKQKKAIQDASDKVKTLIKQFEDLLSTGKTKDRNAAVKMIPGILEANTELQKQEDLAKRAAGGVQSWAASLGRAFQQTISYAASLGVLREAQQLLNQAIQYTIQLNKEMVAIQVLQVEGAKSDAEIRSLALAYNELGKQMGISTLEIAKGSVEWLN
jgi:hypothetical protein